MEAINLSKITISLININYYPQSNESKYELYNYILFYL